MEREWQSLLQNRIEMQKESHDIWSTKITHRANHDIGWAKDEHFTAILKIPLEKYLPAATRSWNATSLEYYQYIKASFHHWILFPQLHTSLYTHNSSTSRSFPSVPACEYFFLPWISSEHPQLRDKHHFSLCRLILPFESVLLDNFHLHSCPFPPQNFF